VNPTPVSSKLLEAGLFSAGEGLWVREAPAALAARLRRVDLVASDVDECMFPFIGQVGVAKHVLRRTVGSVRSADDALLAARMLAMAGVLVADQKIQRLTGNVQNSVLVKKFETMVMDAQVSLFREGADGLARMHYPGMPETLSLFIGRGVPAGMISLGIDLFLDKVLDVLISDHGLVVSFADCTLTTEAEGRFAGYDPGMTLLVPEDKRRLLLAHMNEFGAAAPLVIGHDRDDVGLFSTAREAGGIAVGFNPMPAVYQHLDAAVFAPDWSALHSLFNNWLSEA